MITTVILFLMIICSYQSYDDVKYYHQFCTMPGLQQLIQFSTRVTCSTSTLIDHILTSTLSRVSLKGLINVNMSDH